MTADRWAKLESLFDQALSLSESGRGQWLESLRGRDPALAAEVSRLLRNLDRAGSFFDQAAPAFRAHALEPGEVVADRFEVLELAGVGGMGEVYAARDRELGEQVALKLLPPGLVDRLPHQFRQEVQTARRVAHPNVCRVFDLGKYTRDGAACSFLTMEWIAGPTLAARLAEGPLEPVEADRVLREALAGLEAAHQAGVLHRDLKPSNIMLRDAPLPSGHRVVITDFGLARPNAASEATPASAGVITGTPLYMAPEQIEGVAASVKSDLYAFGLCAYEVFTGQQPLGAGGPLAAIVKRARAKPAAPATLAPRTPAGWNRAILACLEPDPARRPARVSELLTFVETDRVPFSARLPRRQVMLGALTATAASAAGLAAWKLWPAGSAESPGGVRVLVGPAVNQTGEPQFDAWGVALHTQLAQSNHMQPIRPEESPETLQLMRKSAGDPLSAGDLRHLALRLEVPLVLHATLSRVGENYALQLLLEKVAAGSARAAGAWPKTVLAENPRALHSALHEATLWLRRLTGESAEAIQLNAKRPEEVTTDSWEALRDYSQGEQESRAGRTDRAMALFTSATRRDPQFVMAHMRLGDLNFGRGREADGLRAMQQAMAALERRPCSRREELATRAMFASDTLDYAAAVEHYRELEQAYPSDERSLRFRVLPLCTLGRSREAVEVARRYTRMIPKAPRTWHQLAVAAIVAGEFTTAEEALTHLRDGARTNDYFGLQFRLRFQQARYDEAGADLQRAIAVARETGNAIRRSEYERRLAHYWADRRAFDRAEALLWDSIGESERAGFRSHMGQKLASLAYLDWLAGRGREAARRAHDALVADPTVERYRRCGTILARAGERSAVREALAALADLPQVRSARLAAATIRAEEFLRWPGRAAPQDPVNEIPALLPAGWPREYALFRARVMGADLKPAARQVVAAKGIPWLTVEMDWPGAYGVAVDALKDSDAQAGMEFARLRQP